MNPPVWLKVFTIFTVCGLAVSGVMEAFIAESTAAWIGGTLLSVGVTGALLGFMWRGERIRARYHQRLDSLFDRGEDAEGSA